LHRLGWRICARSRAVCGVCEHPGCHRRSACVRAAWCYGRFCCPRPAALPGGSPPPPRLPRPPALLIRVGVLPGCLLISLGFGLGPFAGAMVRRAAPDFLGVQCTLRAGACCHAMLLVIRTPPIYLAAPLSRCGLAASCLARVCVFPGLDTRALRRCAQHFCSTSSAPRFDVGGILPWAIGKLLPPTCWSCWLIRPARTPACGEFLHADTAPPVPPLCHRGETRLGTVSGICCFSPLMLAAPTRLTVRWAKSSTPGKAGPRGMARRNGVFVLYSLSWCEFKKQQIHKRHVARVNRRCSIWSPGARFGEKHFIWCWRSLRISITSIMCSLNFAIGAKCRMLQPALWRKRLNIPAATSGLIGGAFCAGVGKNTLHGQGRKRNRSINRWHQML